MINLVTSYLSMLILDQYKQSNGCNWQTKVQVSLVVLVVCSVSAKRNISSMLLVLVSSVWKRTNLTASYFSFLAIDHYKENNGRGPQAKVQLLVVVLVVYSVLMKDQF